jgi:hypothetical protein
MKREIKIGESNGYPTFSPVVRATGRDDIVFKGIFFGYGVGIEGFFVNYFCFR